MKGHTMKGHRCQWHDLVCDKELESCIECERFPDNEGKPNFTAEPMQALRECSYGVTITVCPACHEPAYEEGRCVFCGQRYTEPEVPPEDMPTVRGAHTDERGEWVCDKCDSTEWRFVFHGDGPRHFINTYNCSKCGAVITAKFKRR